MNHLKIENKQQLLPLVSLNAFVGPDVSIVVSGIVETCTALLALVGPNIEMNVEMLFEGGMGCKTFDATLEATLERLILLSDMEGNLVHSKTSKSRRRKSAFITETSTLLYNCI